MLSSNGEVLPDNTDRLSDGWGNIALFSCRDYTAVKR